MANRNVGSAIGFGRGDKKTATIASGQSAATAVDLGRPYATIVLRCADCSHIQAATTLTVTVGDDADDTACAVYDAATGVKLPVGSLPTSGTYRVVLPAYARFITLTLSQVTSGGTAVFEIYGYDPVVS